MKRSSYLLAALLVIAIPAWVPAQSEDEIDEWFLKAENAFARGRDRKGLGYIERVLKAKPDDVEALRLAIGPAVNVGRYEHADTWSGRLLENKPDDRRARIDRAEVLITRGKLDAAEEVLKPLLGQKAEPAAKELALDFEARGLLAKMRLSRGRRDDAEKIYDSLVQEAKRVLIKNDVRALVALSEAYAFFRGLREAEKVLDEAQKVAKKKEPVDPRPSIVLGWLYLDHFYLPGDAAEEFKAALEARPRLAAANWGLAAAYGAWQKAKPSEEARRRARGTNPHYPEVLLAEASKHLGDMLVDKAQDALDRLFAVDAQHRGGLALQALLHLFAGDRARFDQELKKTFEVDKTYAQAHLLIAGVLNGRRRWPEALHHCRAATLVDPENPEIWDAVARYSLFLGLEKEGHEALRKADKLDRFSHPWRKNMFENRRVLDEFYREFTSRHYVHRVHKQEVDAFKPYLVPFCEKSWRILTKKYKFDPPGLANQPGKVLVEWFRAHQGFAVRTLGFTHLGATGVCFGPFIGMNSPGARKPGEFSWARTFHHELAHTMTVGLSKGRTPRWLTEGLSTYEEKCYEKAWDRGLYRDLFDAIHSDNLCKVVSFDSNFGGPRVIFAYFQGGLVSEWMAEKWGMDKIIAMLQTYGEDKTTTTVLKEVLEVTPQEFDDGFKAWISKRMEPVKLMPRYTATKISEFEEKLASSPKDTEALIGLAAAYQTSGANLDAQEMVYRARKAGVDDPRLHYIEGRLAVAAKSGAKAKEHYGKALEQGFENHDMRMDLARISERGGDNDQAIEHYLKAVATFPMMGGKTDPRLQLARIAQGDGDLETAVRWMEEHVALTYEDLGARKQLLSWYELRKDTKSRRRHLEAMIQVYPLDKTVHVGLGDLYLEQKEGDSAVTEFEVALALQSQEKEEDRSPAEEANIRVQLGSAHLLDPEGADEAEAQAQQALVLVPEHAAAKTLLKKARAARGR